MTCSYGKHDIDPTIPVTIKVTPKCESRYVFTTKDVTLKKKTLSYSTTKFKLDPVDIASLYKFEITGCPIYECKWDDLPSTDAKGKKAFTSDKDTFNMYFDPSQTDIAKIGMSATKVKIACRVQANNTFIEADNKFEIESGKKCDNSLGDAASKPSIANKPYGGVSSTYNLYDANLVKHSTPFGFKTLMGFSVADITNCAW